ncbi:SLBB domain-containing protein [Roseateles violae]|uniref:SLBB domain-containing protein n=1 Tax=Roseateles violae TaxID=3058042 RepID=A0ABT8DWU2_9BURK|nr:SLBB domain-containing protein [Pelomonas sp. PFR6]MDN3920942.1 SLBB domain-containing protein [Pelomonas sp. PFR6]
MTFCKFLGSASTTRHGSGSIDPVGGRASLGRAARQGLLLLTIGAQLLTLNGPALAQSNGVDSRGGYSGGNGDTGPFRLPQQAPRQGGENGSNADVLDAAVPRREPPPPVYIPSEFERYVQRAIGASLTDSRQPGSRTYSEADKELLEQAAEIRRFGSELMTPSVRGGMAPESGNQIPLDYTIGVGDEVLLTLWGSVDADLRLIVDRGGRIVIPRVGPVMVAGLRYADLAPAIEQRVGQVFRNFKLSASMGRLRSIRVYVTGFTRRPGAYTVSSLATLVNALMQAGGPSGVGSYRNIELRRAGKMVSSFDFYDLLIRGDKTADRSLQAEDVIHIGPTGPQVALVGSVNKPAIFELKPGETLDDVLAMAGGFTAVADRSRLSVEHVDARNDTRISELSLPKEGRQQPRSGDLLRAYSAVTASLPQNKQNKRVRIEGEVQHPGEFILPASSSISDAIKAAGGLTRDAYLYGTDFSRESVRLSQQENYERALRDLETEFTRAATTQRTISADDAAAQTGKAQNTARLLERLRALRPTGRIVLQMNPREPSLPNLTLEDGDRLLIPARPSSVGVFGSVFNAGSYLYADGRSVGDFMALAGGPSRGADSDNAFVLRANGSVVSARQKTNGWLMSGGLEKIDAEPGDTVFVPEELNKTTFMQDVKDWTQILYQFGLGAAALVTLKNN